jgi:ribosomal protein S6
MTEALVNAVAQEKLAEVETLVKNLADAEGKLEIGYAKLAYLLRDVSEQRYWLGTYDSFGEFIAHISGTYNIGKSQLYNYLSTARDLGDGVTEEQLNQMGISKALALRDAKNASGTIPQNVLTAALDPKVTVKDIRKLLYDAGTITKPEDGTWCDLDFSCYVSDEERKEINDAANAARHMDPPVDEKQKDFMQRKEILLRFSREFLAAYADSVIEGGRGI